MTFWICFTLWNSLAVFGVIYCADGIRRTSDADQFKYVLGVVGWFVIGAAVDLVLVGVA